MPSKQKINRAKVMASLDTICTECGHAISPDQIRRIDMLYVECPKCGKQFVPSTKQPTR
jgi:predicted RNA-binding Zn-ribbon protein involved in translation (DUF1610 family)